MDIHIMNDYEMLCFFRKVIQNTILSLQKYKQHELIGSNEVNLGITQLETLYSKTFQNISMHVIREDIMKIFQVFGTNNFADFLNIYFLKDKKTFETIRNNKMFSLLCDHFHPINYKEVNWRKANHPSPIAKNKLVDDNMICEKADQLESFDLSRSSSEFFLKSYGIKIAVHDSKQKKTLIVCGMIDDILVNCSENEYIVEKLLSLDTCKPTTEDFSSDSFFRFKSNCTLRDLLVYSNNELYSRFMGYMNQVALVKQKSISQLVKEFVALDLYAQRTMLIQLLLKADNQEYQYMAYLLYDLLSNNSNSNNIDSFEQLRLYDSLPWYCKRFFKEAMNKTIQYTNDLSNYDTSQIPIEQQICLMKVDE